MSESQFREEWSQSNLCKENDDCMLWLDEFRVCVNYTFFDDFAREAYFTSTRCAYTKQVKQNCEDEAGFLDFTQYITFKAFENKTDSINYYGGQTTFCPENFPPTDIEAKWSRQGQKPYPWKLACEFDHDCDGDLICLKNALYSSYDGKPHQTGSGCYKKSACQGQGTWEYMADEYHRQFFCSEEQTRQAEGLERPFKDWKPSTRIFANKWEPICGETGVFCELGEYCR